jgi:hypothetical protein
MPAKANKRQGAHVTPFTGVQGGDMIEHGIRLALVRRAFRLTWWMVPLGSALVSGGFGAYLGEDKLTRGALIALVVGAAFVVAGVVTRFASSESLVATTQAYWRLLDQWTCEYEGYSTHSEYVESEAARARPSRRRKKVGG